jgi:hypothetical protein
MEPRRRNPLRRYPTAVCISVWHFGLTQSKTRALNSPGGKGRTVPSAVVSHCKVLANLPAQKVAKIPAIHS